ncbi:MAG: ABC transporter permease [Deferrisomatales bacterium]
MDYLLRALGAAWALLAGFDPEVWSAVGTSLRVSVTSSALAAALGIPAGAAVALGRFRGRSALLLGLNTLMALPTVVVGLLVYGLVGRQGPLGGLGLLFTPAGIVAGECVLVLPLITNLVVSALEGLDPRFHQTCRALGAGPVATARLALWEARHGVLAAGVAGFGRAIGEVGVAMMLGGNIKGFTRTMTTAIALETSKGEFELGLALGLVLLAVALGVNAALFALRGGGR